MLFYDYCKYWTRVLFDKSLANNLPKFVSAQDPSFTTSKEKVMELDKNGSIERNYDRPIKKDNIQVPTGGYAVLRFKAENPGKYTWQ